MLRHHMALLWSAQFSFFIAINMWPRCGQNSPFILTGLQPGVRPAHLLGNRFNGFRGEAPHIVG
jgi:hypothetical protein